MGAQRCSQEIVPMPLFPAGAVLREPTNSYEELQELAAFWKLETTQLQRGSYKGQIKAVHTAHMQMALVHHGCGTHITGTVPEGTVVLSFPVPNPTCTHIQFSGKPVTPLDLFVQDNRQGLDISFLGALPILSLAIDRQVLERRAAQLWQQEASHAFSGTIPFLSVKESRAVNADLCRTLELTLRTPQDLSGQKMRALERYAVDRVLVSLREKRPPENGIARRWLARRAAALMHEQCHEEMHIGDLCEAVKASRRTLHMGFWELYGMSPMGYLRALRLSGARREILRSHATGKLVTTIATTWGFSHLGRFSMNYRRFFGVLPSEDAGKCRMKKVLHKVDSG